MEVGNKITCPGCGVVLPDKKLLLSESYNASGECNELFNELSGYTLSQYNAEFIHQYSGDAYGAQHAGAPTKNIRVIFALIGLCLAVEHNFTGRQAQLLHMKIPKQEWMILTPPEQRGNITVADVVAANSDEEKKEMIMKWVRSVWESWFQHHVYIREVVARYL